ncbi:MAG: ATP-dependent DNA helicase RecG [Dehalococcoidia bacterium]|nr:MAG: ATP-dependent DNA helicase RecG [Dehalococcoidia bacterium]
MLDVGALRRVLELEEKKAYGDTAVIGGLDRFLRNWSSKAIVSDPALARRLGKLGLNSPDYASLIVAERRAWVNKVLGSLDGLKAGNAGKPPPFPKPQVKRAKPKPPVAVSPASASLAASITSIHGINVATAAKFKKLGVETVRDLLYFFPNRHLDYSQRKTVSQLEVGREETIIANVWEVRLKQFGVHQKNTEAVVGDETGNIRIVWFNNPYVARALKTNDRIVVSGRVGEFKHAPVFESPEWEPADEEGDLIHTGRLVPVYPLTAGLYPRQVRKLLKEVVSRYAPAVEENLPFSIRQRRSLLELPEAIAQAHYPDNVGLKDRARVRLAFDELLLLQLGVLGRKRDWQGGRGNAFEIREETLKEFLGSLPFKLTVAQHRVLGEIIGDLKKAQPMSRLLQGDVGSGKTVVALAVMLVAVASGYQAAFMAPTEILAEQHFRTINRLLGGGEDGGDYRRTLRGFGGRPVELACLLGDVRQAKKRELQGGIGRGELDIIVGTHALIQKGVTFDRLGLVVVDEQHRFGVEQRLALKQKGNSPHMLAMTATPIPRTLALTLYGDLDLSVIGEMPPGRQVIKTKWLGSDQRPQAYGFIRRQVQAGHQAFIICPLILESEAVAAKAAVAEYQRLRREVFPDLELGLLHGRMKAAEKDLVMRRFRDGELNLLVSTAVVEVGIDVPNATVMMVESADRFGLSQLHQFRGRVGRGAAQSYCILIAESPSEIGQKRLDIIERVNDGFVLAEEDLKLRGPGEFFGTRQSGLPDLRMAHLSDVALLEMARSEAQAIFKEDAGLAKPEHRQLAVELARVWQHRDTELS